MLMSWLLLLLVAAFTTDAVSVKKTPLRQVGSGRTRMVPPENKAILSPEDDFFRQVRRVVPLRAQYLLRDWGILRLMVDSLTWTTAIPSILREKPEALPRFLLLSGIPPSIVSQFCNIIGVNYASVGMPKPVSFRRIRYGGHHRQVLDLIETTGKQELDSKRIICFVHGGAWGSGLPVFYRLMAYPFLKNGIHAVAFVGYRTYPTGNVEEQQKDVISSLAKLQESGYINSQTHVTLMGHSSGTHISAMALLKNQELQKRINSFVALSGVYEIPRHYVYEKSRGVERFSPMAMAAACGNLSSPGSVLSQWKKQSPTWLLENGGMLESFPETLILHGQNDTTVPVESPQRFYASLQRNTNSCIGLTMEVLPLGHADVITQIMFGGITRDSVLNWLETNVCK
jgi:acetyl esterase/lipase